MHSAQGGIWLWLVGHGAEMIVLFLLAVLAKMVPAGLGLGGNTTCLREVDQFGLGRPLLALPAAFGCSLAPGLRPPNRSTDSTLVLSLGAQ